MNPNELLKTSGGLNQGSGNLGFNPSQTQDSTPLPVEAMSQGTQSQLDPSIVALTKAIGLAESGGKYDIPSEDKKSIPSAYQFTPGFISDYAPKYLKNYDPNNLTPAQQDELAYNVVKEWGTTGNKNYPYLGKLTPAQIASAWNAGDPMAYLEEGGHAGLSNGHPYNTEEYVNNVQENYNQASQPEQKTGMTDFDKKYTAPIAGVLGAGAVAAGMAVAPEAGVLAGLGTLAENAWTGVKNVVGGIPKALIGGVVSDAVKSAMPESVQSVLPSSQSDYASMILGNALPQASESSNKLASVMSEALGMTQGGRRLLQDPNMQEAINTGGKYGLTPDVDENGNMNFSNSIQEANNHITKLSQANESVLKDEYTNFEQAIANAKKNVEEYTPNDLQEEALRTIDKEARAYTKFVNKDGNIPLDKLETMKREQWHRFDKNDSTGRLAGKKALGFGARQAITDNTQHKDFYNAAMREEQRLIGFQKVAKRLNEKKAPEHFSLAKNMKKFGAEYVSTWIGAKIGGPIGAVLGDIVGQHIIGAIDKKHGKNIFETPQVQRAIFEIKKEHPEVFTRLVEELQKEGIKMRFEKDKGILKIEGPKGIPLDRYKGKDESIVVGGKRPPATFEQAKNRKAGRPEYGGLHGYLMQQQDMKKAAGLIPPPEYKGKNNKNG